MRNTRPGLPNAGPYVVGRGLCRQELNRYAADVCGGTARVAVAEAGRGGGVHGGRAAVAEVEPAPPTHTLGRDPEGCAAGGRSEPSPQRRVIAGPTAGQVGAAGNGRGQ